MGLPGGSKNKKPTEIRRSELLLRNLYDHVVGEYNAYILINYKHNKQVAC